MMMISFFISCGPSQVDEDALNKLVGDWKTTSEEALALSEDVGNQLSLVQADSSNTTAEQDPPAVMDEAKANCENSLKELQSKVASFIEEWRESSLEFDELTNQMQMTSWTEENAAKLDAMELELRKKEVDIAQWRKDLEEINQRCGIPNATMDETQI
jgi:chromosome segregation ATPase